MDEHGFVLDILLQRHRDTEAAKTFLTRLLGEYDVPEVIHTDQLRSYGAAIREIPSLINVDHQQVISTARCNNIILQEHRSTKATRAISARMETAETRSRVLELARPDRQSSPSFPHQRHRRHPKKRAGVLKGVRSAQETTRSKRSRRGQ
jgi:transposase-like protein